MAEITNGTIVPLSNALGGQNDSNGKLLKFKAQDEKNPQNTTWTAEGSDGIIYTIQAQPQVATITTVKKQEAGSLPRINDPYYIRMEANRPKAGNAETTEERESKAAGKVAKREDVQPASSSSGTTTTTTTASKSTK